MYNITHNHCYPRPLTAPGFTPRYVNAPATFTVPQLTAAQTSHTKPTATMAHIGKPQY